MKAKLLLDSLQKRLKTTSQASLASALGVSVQTLHNWKTKNISLSAAQLANAISKSNKAAVKQSQLKTIQPIVEFYKIDACKTKKGKGASSQILDTGNDSNSYRQGLRASLEKTNGVYIFYDSRGRALYAGKAKDQSLWKEMNLAFNRVRELQKITLSHHPDRNQEFQPGHEKLRQPKKTQRKLCDLAYYFSAYKIDYGMINDLEALLVRGFANDLLNAKMEKFTHNRTGN
jgi:DNA-binding XRE family transcriptional regulator